MRHRSLTHPLLTSSAIAGLIATVSLTAVPVSAQEATVIQLTQTGCQFLEPENGVDHAFVTTGKSDCDAIDATTGEERLAESTTLTLEPGDYVFRITNRNVPYELGFWLRDHDYNFANPIHKLTKTSISGGGLEMGKTQDYRITLKPGEYVYSCPLNPTPDYRLVVTGS